MIKEKENIYEKEIDAKTAADFLKINLRMFYRLVEDGTLPKVKDGVYILGEITEAYFKSQNSLKGLTAAKTRLANAKAEMAEIELNELKGDLARVSIVSKVWSENVQKARAKLLAIPTKIARELIGQDEKMIEAKLKREIYEALKELAEYDGEKIKRATRN